MQELKLFLIKHIYGAIHDYDENASVFSHNRTEHELQYEPAANRFKLNVTSEDEYAPDFHIDDFSIEIVLAEMKLPIIDPESGKISEALLKKGVMDNLKIFERLNKPKDAQIQKAYYVMGGHPECRLRGLDLYVSAHVGGFMKTNPEYLKPDTDEYLQMRNRPKFEKKEKDTSESAYDRAMKVI